MAQQIPTVTQSLLSGRKKESIERSTRRSSDWLENRIREFQTVAGKRKGQTSRPAPGSMYLYRYKAKLDGKLPFWDRYPLIVMVDYPKQGDGFYGLNLHYLPPRKRILLLDSLIKVSNMRKISANSKMKLNYGIVKAAAKFWQPCFKRYLYSHVVTKPIKINPEEWYQTASLPLANFKGASRPAVYKWSSKYY